MEKINKIKAKYQSEITEIHTDKQLPEMKILDMAFFNYGLRFNRRLNCVNKTKKSTIKN
jgi:hypothetical protein